MATHHEIRSDPAMPSAESRSQGTLEKLLKAAAQLNPRELEHFVTRLLVLRAQRIAPGLAKEEARLLGQINQGLPPADQKRYDELTSKRQAEALSTEEHQELLRMIDRIEQADAERVGALGRLAQLRDVSLESLMEDLGIHAPAYG